MEYSKSVSPAVPDLMNKFSALDTNQAIELSQESLNVSARLVQDGNLSTYICMVVYITNPQRCLVLSKYLCARSSFCSS